MLINPQPISNVLGALLVFVGVIMWMCIPVSLITQDGQWTAFVYSGMISMAIGGTSWLYKFKSTADFKKREGYLIVVLSWVCVSLLCMLPYLFSDSIDTFTNALFESVSGFTTTGATIIGDIEATSPSILFWRSITQWLGGMGIIVLTIALFPLLGIAGIELFVAEAPGPTSDKIHPRIKDTAQTLWFVYVGLTVILFVILMLEGMNWFDAINHALTTVSTGGFSTKNASIAHFASPMIQYTIMLFMFLAGTNFAMIYFGLTGKFKKVINNEEFRMYTFLVIGCMLIGTITLQQTLPLSIEESFRAISFSIISVLTTTGYVSHDYMSWSNGFTISFFILLFCGACAGSTSGGIKLIRHLVFMRNTILEFKRILHPRAMIRIKINKNMVQPKILTHILVFLLVYLFTFIVGAITLSLMGLDFLTAIGASATSLGNVGPGLGSVGPIDNFAHLSDGAKYVTCFLMICGRLELFTVLVIFTPYFWRDH